MDGKEKKEAKRKIMAVNIDKKDPINGVKNKVATEAILNGRESPNPKPSPKSVTTITPEDNIPDREIFVRTKS